jgi:hypothetical protein
MIEGTDYEAKFTWVGYSEPSVADFAFCDMAKKYAGKEFHTEGIKSAIVYDREGKVWLYLVKDENGHVIREKVVDVKSPEY